MSIVKAKWQSLRNGFRNAMNREKTKMKSGSAGGRRDQKVKSDWKYWDALMFLLPNYTMEPTQSNVNRPKSETVKPETENLTLHKKKFTGNADKSFPPSDDDDEKPVLLFQKRDHKQAFDEEMLYHPDYDVEFPKKKRKFAENSMIASSVETINNTCKLLSSSIQTPASTQVLQATSNQNVNHDDLDAFSRLIFSELKQLTRLQQLKLKKAILDLVSSFTLDLVFDN